MKLALSATLIGSAAAFGGFGGKKAPAKAAGASRRPASFTKDLGPGELRRERCPRRRAPAALSGPEIIGAR
ncbi:hypothetical protein JL721_7093 [Aureococcus anophagefferens]|nr:hypothetical protein JL721_7093 [Aureococcus anophagefferens]